MIDRARALRELRQLIENETDGATIGQRRFVELLNGRGFPISQSALSGLDYAFDRLLPLLPRALGSGLGRRAVAGIRALENAARSVWSDRGCGSDAEFSEAFESLCRRYDGPTWDHEQLRRAIEAEIAERAEQSIQGVGFELDDRIAGRPVTIAEPTPDYELASSAGPKPQPSPAKPASGRKSSADVAASTPADRADPEAPVASEPSHDGSVEAGTNIAQVTALSPTPAQTTATAAPALPFKSLRARAWVLACRLAQRNGLPDLIVPLHDVGLGFMVRDIPDPALTATLDEQTLAKVTTVWWMLAACAELTVAPLNAVVPLLSVDSILQKALAEQDAALLFESVWTLDPGQMGYRLWRLLDDRDWQDVVGLMETYRTLRLQAAALGIELWRKP